MTKTKTDLNELANNMDEASTSINTQFEVLEDIKTNFFLLVEDMNNHKETKDLKLRFDEWHRELRILSQLMHYSMKEADEHVRNVNRYSEDLFDEIDRAN